jgi:hypothetical protein
MAIDLPLGLNSTLEVIGNPEANLVSFGGLIILPLLKP